MWLSKKICPINGFNTQCITDECAWFIESKGHCAVKMIAMEMYREIELPFVVMPEVSE